MRRLLLAALAVIVLGAVAAGAWAYLLVERPYKGYADDEAFVEIVPGSNPHTMGRALSEAGVVAERDRFQAGRVAARCRTPPAGGGVSFRRADDAARRRRQNRARRRISAPGHLPRRFDHPPDGGGVRGTRLRRAEGVHRRRGEGRTRPGARSTGAGPRGLSLSRHLHVAAPHDSRRSRRAHDRRASRRR